MAQLSFFAEESAYLGGTASQLLGHPLGVGTQGDHLAMQLVALALLFASPPVRCFQLTASRFQNLLVRRSLGEQLALGLVDLLATLHHLAAQGIDRSRQTLWGQQLAMFIQHPPFDLEEIGPRPGRFAKNVVTSPTIVAIFASHRSQVVKGGTARQTDQELPVLEEVKAGIELSGFGEQTTLDEQGVEGNVVVEQQDVRIKIAAVGQAAFHRAPTTETLALAPRPG